MRGLDTPDHGLARPCRGRLRAQRRKSALRQRSEQGPTRVQRHGKCSHRFANGGPDPALVRLTPRCASLQMPVDPRELAQQLTRGTCGLEGLERLPDLRRSVSGVGDEFTHALGGHAAFEATNDELDEATDQIPQIVGEVGVQRPNDVLTVEIEVRSDPPSAGSRTRAPHCRTARPRCVGRTPSRDRTSRSCVP